MDVLYVRDEKAAATDGGTASSDTWNVRDLNTEVVNQITGASLSSNRVTLPAGTYRIRARAAALAVGRHQLRWRRDPAGTPSTELYGSSAYTISSDFVATDAVIWARFTIASEETFELQHYTELARSSDGLGKNSANASGETNVYAEVWIEKEA